MSVVEYDIDLGLRQETEVVTSGYHEYQNRGGILPAERYDESVSIRKRYWELDEPLTFKNPIDAQFAGVLLSNEDNVLYRYFRSIMPPDSNKETDVYCLSDQQLIAQVLLLTGKMDDYRVFTSYYSNIFN